MPINAVLSLAWFVGLVRWPGYYRSRIKCLLFMLKIQLKRVCGMVKNGAHTILKIKKRKVPQIFCFFSMVWGDLDVTGAVWILGTKSRHFILLR